MRTRHQDGWVEERGKKRKRWYGHFYVYVKDAAGKETREHRGVTLGEKSRIRKWEAEAELRKVIARHSKGQPAAEHQTMQWFVDERFLPMKMPLWAPSTCATNKGNLTLHILPVLGAITLGTIDKFQCQTFINDLAKAGYSHTVVDHCRTMLHAIFDEALEADLIAKNPARKLENPDTAERPKPVMPKNDAKRLIEEMPLRDKLIAMIAAFCAMRPGEIFGLRWSSWLGDSLKIEGTAWRGTLRHGKAKTSLSKAPVAIPEVLMALLQEWRSENSTAGLDSLIFPSLTGGPMRPENWLRRRVKPIAARLGLRGQINFQVLRRSFATNAQGYGNPKDVQAHLRHADIGTTLNVYTQPISASVRKLVNAVTDDIMKSELIN